MVRAIAVEPVDPGDRHREEVVAALTEPINRVYTLAEAGLWRDEVTRTTTSELADLIGAGELAVATSAGRMVGTVRVHDLAADTGEFGMLAAEPSLRGAGVGRALVEFAERSSTERGLHAMRLELLVPRNGRHESKDFLRAWYRRRGYRLVGTAGLESTHPHLVRLLASPCDLEIYEKRLPTIQG